MKEDLKFSVITPPTRIKYKKFCKDIYNKHRKEFIFTDNNEKHISIPLLMDILVEKLEDKKNEEYASKRRIFARLDLIDGILDIINNNTYWRRY